MILDWKVIPNKLQFDGCFSLNFGYHENSLSIPQLAMTPDSNLKLNYDSPIGCLFVMIGGKYLNPTYHGGGGFPPPLGFWALEPSILI